MAFGHRYSCKNGIEKVRIIQSFGKNKIHSLYFASFWSTIPLRAHLYVFGISREPGEWDNLFFAPHCILQVYHAWSPCTPCHPPAVLVYTTTQVWARGSGSYLALNLGSRQSRKWRTKIRKWMWWRGSGLKKIDRDQQVEGGLLIKGPPFPTKCSNSKHVKNKLVYIPE